VSDCTSTANNFKILRVGYGSVTKMARDKTPKRAQGGDDDPESDCVFCQIVQGQMPAHKIYEDDSFLAFLDIRPLNLGHAVVIPKEHHRWVWDMPQVGDYFEVCNKVANAQREVLDTDWVVSMVFGEEVNHAHVWLVPRFEGDGHGGSIDLEEVKDLEGEEMETIRDKLAAELEK